MSAQQTKDWYTPEEAQALFAQANEAYSREDYAAAIQGYERLLERGLHGADLLYNLGTAYLAKGDLGYAVLHLERARREGGDAPDVEAQLAVARSRQLDQVVGAQAEEPFLTRLTAATHAQASGWVFLSAWLVLFMALFAFRLQTRGRRGWTVVAILSALALALPSGGILAAHAYAAQAVTEAVIVAPTARARELPRKDAKVAFELHGGLKVRALERAGGFVRIRLPNGLEGWTEEAALVKL